jgi:PhnB protein
MWKIAMLSINALWKQGPPIRESGDQFYGDRTADMKDQYGNRWWIATHKVDLSKEEIAKRMDEAMKQEHH